MKYKPQKNITTIYNEENIIITMFPLIDTCSGVGTGGGKGGLGPPKVE